MEKTLQEAIAKLPAYKTEVFKGVLEQLRWFAGKQVKSVAVSPYSGTLKILGTGLFLTCQGVNLASAADPVGFRHCASDCLGCLLKCRFLGSTLRDSCSIGLG